MARKGWDSLSPGYRQRLEKSGIGKAGYDRGESLQKARGHAQTPERPKASNAQQFPRYHNERQKLVNAVNRKKQDFFGTSPKWNPQRAKANMSKHPPSLAKLRWALDASYEDWLDAIRESPEEYAWLGYH